MSLLSMYKRDDSRTVYRILAEQAVKYLDQPKTGTESRIIFTNLARLLERYRYDAFSYDARNFRGATDSRRTVIFPG